MNKLILSISNIVKKKNIIQYNDLVFDDLNIDVIYYIFLKLDKKTSINFIYISKKIYNFYLDNILKNKELDDKKTFINIINEVKYIINLRNVIYTDSMFKMIVYLINNNSSFLLVDNKYSGNKIMKIIYILSSKNGKTYQNERKELRNLCIMYNIPFHLEKDGIYYEKKYGYMSGLCKDTINFYRKEKQTIYYQGKRIINNIENPNISQLTNVIHLSTQAIEIRITNEIILCYLPTHMNKTYYNKDGQKKLQDKLSKESIMRYMKMYYKDKDFKVYEF